MVVIYVCLATKWLHEECRLVNAGHRVIIPLMGAQSSSDIDEWRMRSGMNTMQAPKLCCSGGLQCNAEEAGGGPRHQKG